MQDEEQKLQEVQCLNELMSEFVKAGLYHVESMPDVLNYSRTNAMIDPLKDMQDLMVLYENYRKSEEQMRYTLKTIVAVASFFVPFGSGYGVAFFTFSRITSAASVYYNLDKAVEAYDASVLVDTRNVEREARGLTNFEEGSQAEAIYEIAGNMATFYTDAVVSDYAMAKMFSLADYDFELLPKETAVPEVEFTPFNLETPRANNVSAFGEIAEGSPEEYLEFQMKGSREGLTAEELKGITKVDEKIALDRINYDDVLELRNGKCGKSIKTSYGKSNGSSIYQSSSTTKGYSNFADGMSPEDAARYIANNEKAFFNEFSERARAAGLNSAHIEEAFTAMRTGDYAKMASYFDTSSPVNGAVFWSGNKEGAAAYANSIGGTIMEQTPGGRVFDNWRGLQGMYPEWDTVTDLNQKPIWDALSSQYANGAEGMATYVHPSGYEGKVWLNIEKPILEENNIIFQEVIIDAK